MLLRYYAMTAKDVMLDHNMNAVISTADMVLLCTQGHVDYNPIESKLYVGGSSYATRTHGRACGDNWSCLVCSTTRYDRIETAHENVSSRPRHLPLAVFQKAPQSHSNPERNAASEELYAVSGVNRTVPLLDRALLNSSRQGTQVNKMQDELQMDRPG